MRVRFHYGRPCTEHDNIGVTDEEFSFLYSLAFSLTPKCIVEVGTGSAVSLSAFNRAKNDMLVQKKWHCEILTCDIRKGPVATAQEKYPDIKCILGDRTSLVEHIQEPPELVFIDGLHTGEAVRKDYEAIYPLCAEGCVFVFHDANPKLPDIQDFVLSIGGVILPTPRAMGISTKGIRPYPAGVL